MEKDDFSLNLLERRGCSVIFAKPVPGDDAGFQAGNIGLALAVVDRFGLGKDRALSSMRCMQRDRYDFQVFDKAGASVAMAFSANDIASTRRLFESLSWPEEDTRLIYNHRKDRPGRFESFLGWLEKGRWREVLIMGDRPYRRRWSARYVRISNADGLLRLFRPDDLIFGCGNIAGVPLELARMLRR
jgi:hypothetical protein